MRKFCETLETRLQQLCFAWLFALYFVIQFIAVIPSEILSSSLKTNEARLGRVLTRAGLAPGMEIFGGDFKSRIPHNACVVVFGRSSRGAEVMYRTELCPDRPYRLIENTFESYLTYYADAQRWNAVGRARVGQMFCNSPLFGNGRFDLAYLAVHSEGWSFNFDQLDRTTQWVVKYDCRGQKLVDDVDAAVTFLDNRHG